MGRIDGEFVLNPTHEELGMSDIDLFVAGSEDAIIMVEGSAREVREAEVLEAILFGHQSLKPVIDLQREIAQALGTKPKDYDIRKPDEAVYEKVEKAARRTTLGGLSHSGEDQEKGTGGGDLPVRPS